MERFFVKIKKTDNCWIWIAGTRGKSGYGAFKLNGKVVDAHRVSYILHKGSIPDGILVCHKCDNRLCVNPEHLFLGTYSDNMLDCKSKGRLKTPTNAHLIKHPSLSAYSNHGCRCEECRNLAREKIKNQRARGIKT